jgi:hypothetical protein
MRLADWANVRLDSWIRVVVYHELVHIMDLDIATGTNALLRKIFGRIVLPNMNKPITFIEGLAVYEKYKHLGESRLNDANTIMMIRQMVLENRIPRFDEISRYYNRASWPPVGLLVYNFSSWFLRYIEETYGPDSMKRFNDVNSASLVNTFSLLFFGDDFDSIIKRALNKSALMKSTQAFAAWLRQKVLCRDRGDQSRRAYIKRATVEARLAERAAGLVARRERDRLSSQGAGSERNQTDTRRR